ncbi:peptidylprolyl isomerase [Neisseria weaveri]|uniref:peptidylprolyl isomerase n=1 Tax=Neisseria weaveri TaxID=28091 RepID=UPI0002232097|nr:peptidylprolyl isomerase [Neisseria weaveri]EGV36628.1 hypothetical protein l13_07220 [Neisseria weaveri ATCC 51223]
MNFKSLILAAAVALSFQTASAADIKLVDGIAAVADGAVITHKDVRKAMATAKASLPKNAQVDDAELRSQVLSQLINRTLMIEAGKRRNISVGNAEIDAALQQLAAERKTNVDGLYAAAAKDGLSRAALRREIADGIIMQRVQQQAVMQNARVSEAEIDAMIARASEQGIALPEGAPIRQYRAQHILLKGESANALAAAESGIRKLYDQARSGADFAMLARQFSQDGSAAAGGDLGWFTDGQMVPEFEHAVHTLKAGQVSRPVKTQFGWHIIKLTDVRDAGTPEERRRNAVRQFIAEKKTEQATIELLKQLHEGAFIDIRGVR